MKIGEKVPDFTLVDERGEPYRLFDHIGQRGAVVFFYPKDNSAVCTAEVCAFRDQFQTFSDAGIEVVGISSDSIDSHKEFSKKNALNFRILSDREGTVRKAWRVPDALGFIPGRVTFVVTSDGTLVGKFSGMLNASAHVSAAIKIAGL